MKASPSRLFLWIFMAMALGAIIAGVYLDGSQTPISEVAVPGKPAEVTGFSAPSTTSNPRPLTLTAHAPNQTPPKPPVTAKLPTHLVRPKIAILIDDVGLRRDVLDPFWSIPEVHGRLSWAIIPGTQFANELGQDLADKNECILAHIPMEPTDRNQVTPTLGNYLMVDSDAPAIQQELRRRMAAFDPKIRTSITGLSNHQGSRFTADVQGMRTLLTFLAKENLFFVDSRTNSRTVGTRIAKKMGVPVAERQVFLDNTREVSAIEAQLDELLLRAQQDGKAIGIGHPYAETARALARWIRRHKDAFELVPVSELLSRE